MTLWFENPSQSPKRPSLQGNTSTKILCFGPHAGFVATEGVESVPMKLTEGWRRQGTNELTSSSPPGRCLWPDFRTYVRSCCCSSTRQGVQRSYRKMRGDPRSIVRAVEWGAKTRLPKRSVWQRGREQRLTSCLSTHYIEYYKSSKVE